MEYVLVILATTICYVLLFLILTWLSCREWNRRGKP